MSLKSLETSNQLLGFAVIEAEQMETDQHKICEVVREELNAESKILISLKEELHWARSEMATLETQMKRVNDDISRTGEFICRERKHHQSVDCEQVSIDAAIAGFNKKLDTLEQKKVLNEAALAKIGHGIDIEHAKKDLMRQKYRTTMGEKDIVSSRLVAVESSRVKAEENFQTLKAITKASEDQHRVLKDKLETTKKKNNHLMEEYEACTKQIEHQREREELLAELEKDLSTQCDRNSALAVEIGRPINLHRWRHLRDKSPDEFQMLETIQRLQKQAVDTTSNIALRSRQLKSKKKELSTLKLHQEGKESEDDVSRGLLKLKSELRTLNKEIKAQEVELQTRIRKANVVNNKLEDLEKKRMETKANYVVSVIGSCSEFVRSANHVA